MKPMPNVSGNSDVVVVGTEISLKEIKMNCGFTGEFYRFLFTAEHQAAALLRALM